MNKRIFIIHGWGGSPDKDWIPWAKARFEELKYQTVASLMPDTDIPEIKPWVDKLREIVGKTRGSDILIGHSIGCQTILRFLEGLKSGEKIDKAILIAPWVKLTNLENETAWKIAEPWLKTPIDFPKIKPSANRFIVVFSDNDSWVPLKENLNYFRRKLNPEVLVLTSRGHFTQDEGITQLPEILNLIETNDSQPSR